MLKRSEYVVMSLSFVFMLAIFLVISMNYITDSAASNNEIVDKFDSSTHVADTEKLDKDYLIITGDDNTVCKNVKQALYYAKKGYKVSTTAYDLNASDLKDVKAIIVTTADLNTLGDMRIVMNISDRIYVMDYGKLIAQGTPKEIAVNPDVIRAYLGESEDEA